MHISLSQYIVKRTVFTHLLRNHDRLQKVGFVLFPSTLLVVERTDLLIVGIGLVVTLEVKEQVLA